MGRGKSQAEPVTGKSISCRESLCPGHCKSYKIEVGMGFDTRKVMHMVAQTPAGGGLDLMCTKRFQKTSGVKQCNGQNYVKIQALKLDIKMEWQNLGKKKKQDLNFT